MTSLFLGLYGIYLIAVGAQGNAATLAQMLGEDSPRYVPWLLAIIAIAVLSQYETTEKLVKPFILLLVLNFVLMNFDTIRSEISKIYQSSMTGA